MRKGAGISALQRHTATNTSYSSLSANISASQLESLQSSLEQFKEHLLIFARNHRDDIRRDPAFRHQFQKMCAAIGVDPLAGGGRGASGPGGKGGWWADVLGLGEWQFELAVQVVDVCVSTRERNGGTISMPDLLARVERMRGIKPDDYLAAAQSGKEQKGKDTQEGRINANDIIASLRLLKPLGAGYSVLEMGGITYIRSVPKELDTDQSMLLVLASDTGGRLYPADVADKTGWSLLRANTALEDAVMREGIAWVDEQEEGVVAMGGRVIWVMPAVDFGDS